jgi:hypothetical protein
MESLLETDRKRLEAEQAEGLQTRARERRAVLLTSLIFALIAALALGVALAVIF